MVLSAGQGLPYLQFWDEPIINQGALNGIKTGQFTPWGVETVHGGLLRYVCMSTDVVYFGYLKLAGQADSFNDIKTGLDDAHLSISHPGFYYWNRIAVSAISLLGYVFVFLIGRLKYNNTVGLISCLMLMSVYYYYSTAFQVKTNVPLGTWFMGTLYFALKYNTTSNFKELRNSLIFVGLAFSTKYTGALFILIPATAFLFNNVEMSRRPFFKFLKRIIGLGLIPLGVFILFNPLIYIWPKPIVDRIKWVSEVYKTGAGHATKEPGWEQISFQATTFYENIGIYISVLFLVGILIGLGRLFINKIKTANNQLFIISVAFPTLYFLFITRYAISYHHNYLLLYPFIILLASEALYLSCLTLSNIIKFDKFRLMTIVLPLTIVLFFTWKNYVGIVGIASKVSVEPDTRTVAINWLESNGRDDLKIAVIKGLPIRSLDLKRVSTEYKYVDYVALEQALKDYTYVLVPDFMETVPITDESYKEKLRAIIQDSRVFEVSGSGIVYNENRDPIEPIANPTVTILSLEIQ